MVGTLQLSLFAVTAVTAVDLPGDETVSAEFDATCRSTYPSQGMPNFKQCDTTWKCFPYAGETGLSSCTESVCRDGGPANQTNNICGSGCGITSSAMVLSYFGSALTPPDVAKWFLSQGFRNDRSSVFGATCDGVSHTAICNAAEHWGKSCEESMSFDDLDRWLQGGPVIAHMVNPVWPSPGRCKFTRVGHYIVITGHAEDSHTYSVSDPNSCAESNTHATQSELSVDCELAGFVRMFDANPMLYV
jgi:uncharacterized protein YvpB